MPPMKSGLLPFSGASGKLLCTRWLSRKKQPFCSTLFAEIITLYFGSYSFLITILMCAISSIADWSQENGSSWDSQTPQIADSVSLKNDDDDLLVQKLFKIEQKHEFGKQLFFDEK
jgi:hypothetical protein